MFTVKKNKTKKTKKQNQALIYPNVWVIAKILEDKKDTKGKGRIFSPPLIWVSH